MNSASIDLSIFRKFDFEIEPVGIQFSISRPEGVERLPKKLALCEMFKEAQEADLPFYTDFENHTCGGGPGTLGLNATGKTNFTEVLPIIHSGRLGPRLKIFKNPLANRRTLLSFPRLEEGTVRYVTFSKFDRLSFEPDILLVTASPRQAEIILRANSYTTGAIWEHKTTTIVGCSWLVAYPYLTGRLNYTVTGLGFGMIARELWPQGLILVSIPSDLLPMITRNLQDMEWVLPSYRSGRDGHIGIEEAIFEDFRSELKKRGSRG